jgi:hypothetical protein
MQWYAGSPQPLLTGNSDTAESLLDGLLIKTIKLTTATSSKKNVSRSPILNKKIPRMKFKEGVIITCKFFDGKEITCDVRKHEGYF